LSFACRNLVEALLGSESGAAGAGQEAGRPPPLSPLVPAAGRAAQPPANGEADAVRGIV